MHRTYRNDMPQQQKDKIAAANKGRRHTQATKAKISRSMQKYWQRLPFKPVGDSGTTQNTDTNPYN